MPGTLSQKIAELQTKIAQYDIIRVYHPSTGKKNRKMKSVETLAEAQKHTRDPSTRKEGVYFDAYNPSRKSRNAKIAIQMSDEFQLTPTERLRLKRLGYKKDDLAKYEQNQTKNLREKRYNKTPVRGAYNYGENIKGRQDEEKAYDPEEEPATALSPLGTGLALKNKNKRKGIMDTKKGLPAATGTNYQRQLRKDFLSTRGGKTGDSPYNQGTLSDYRKNERRLKKKYNYTSSSPYDKKAKIDCPQMRLEALKTKLALNPGRIPYDTRFTEYHGQGEGINRKFESAENKKKRLEDAKNYNKMKGAMGGCTKKKKSSKVAYYVQEEGNKKYVSATNTKESDAINRIFESARNKKKRLYDERNFSKMKTKSAGDCSQRMKKKRYKMANWMSKALYINRSNK